MDSVEPVPSRWTLPTYPFAADDELVGFGADLQAGTLLKAYRSGIFPMPFQSAAPQLPDGQIPIGWWSPDPRGILPLDGLIISKSLRRALQKFEVRIDTAFDEVMVACADPKRQHGWIDENIRRAYRELFDLGWAHSVETWLNGELVGGLYGIAINGLFAGESMFHHERDASKVALVALVEHLNKQSFLLLDVQWRTDHLASLGVLDVTRDEYQVLLEEALAVDATF